MEDRDLHNIVGDGLSDVELNELRRIDRLLNTSEPLPEIPNEIEMSVRKIPKTEAQVDHRRRQINLTTLASNRTVVLGAATVMCVIAFFIGWAIRGGGSNDPSSDFTIELNATRFASNDASMVLTVFQIDENGNRMLRADVSGLEPVTGGQYYELWLTRNKRAVASCGRFLVNEFGIAQKIRLNAPYEFTEFDDWVVTREGPDDQRSRVLLRAPVITSTS